MYSKESVKNAIKMNELEGMPLTNEEIKMLNDIADGKISVEEFIKQNVEKYMEAE